MKKLPLISLGVVLLIVVAGFVFLSLKIRSLENDKADLFMRLAKAQGTIVYTPDSSAYAALVVGINSLKSENAELNKTVKQLGAKIGLLTNIVIDGFDSVLADVPTAVSEDSTRATFVYSTPDSFLSTSGSFQIVPPYGLKFDYFRYHMSMEVGVLRNRDGSYMATVSGLPPYLKPTISSAIDPKVFKDPLRMTLSVGPYAGLSFDRGNLFYGVVGTAQYGILTTSLIPTTESIGATIGIRLR